MRTVPKLSEAILFAMPLEKSLREHVAGNFVSESRGRCLRASFAQPEKKSNHWICPEFTPTQHEWEHRTDLYPPYWLVSQSLLLSDLKFVEYVKKVSPHTHTAHEKNVETSQLGKTTQVLWKCFDFKMGKLCWPRLFNLGCAVCDSHPNCGLWHTNTMHVFHGHTQMVISSIFPDHLHLHFGVLTLKCGRNWFPSSLFVCYTL